MNAMTELPASVQCFERVLFTGLHAVGLDPNDFHPRLIEQETLDAAFPDSLTGPGMAISQIAWDIDGDIVVTQECLLYFADLVEPEKQVFGVLRQFSNELTPEMVAAMYLAHMVKGELLWPPGMRPVIANGLVHIERDPQES
jgi:hypothetical protein